jgi:hypothetical protein
LRGSVEIVDFHTFGGDLTPLLSPRFAQSHAAAGVLRHGGMANDITGLLPRAYSVRASYSVIGVYSYTSVHLAGVRWCLRSYGYSYKEVGKSKSRFSLFLQQPLPFSNPWCRPTRTASHAPIKSPFTHTHSVTHTHTHT